MTPEPAHSPASSVLLVRTSGGERSLSAGRSYYIGRDPQSDIVVNDSRVSWRHAVLRQDGSDWLLEDAGSTNGTFQGRDRVQRIAIAESCAVRLGHPDDGPAMSCSVAAPARQAEGAPAGYAPPTRYAEASPAGGGYADGPPGGGLAAARGGLGAGAAAAAPAPPVGPPDPGVPSQRLSMDRLPSAVLRLPTTLLRIGRAADNQVVIADHSVSR
jgi:pSer/pThr/pTyr-binding forkhead associated (FHA) protein